VDELFIAGDATDTKTIRDYYQSTTHTGETFNPVERIREPLKKRVVQLTGSREKKPEWRWVPSTLLAVIGFFCFLQMFFFIYTRILPGRLCWLSCSFSISLLFSK
jgi:hypothetical protein